MSSDPNHSYYGLTHANHEAQYCFPQGDLWNSVPSSTHPLVGPGVAPPSQPEALSHAYHALVSATCNGQSVAQVALAPLPPSPQPVPSQARTARSEQDVTHLDFSIPKNTGVIGRVVTRTNLRLPCDMSFVDFWDRICAHMDLDPAEAELGYRFSSDRAGDNPRSLATEHDLATAIELGQGLVRRARTRKIEVMIFNLKPANQSGANSKKRKEPSDPGNQAAITEFTEELWQLKEHLTSATHTGRWCYVSPIDGHHKQLDIFVFTLWAKKIFLKEATFTQPPNLLQFDHRAKCCCVSPASTQAIGPSNVTTAAPAVPAIHVHLNKLPLTNQGGNRRLNIPRPLPDGVSDDSGDDAPLIQYLPIGVLLQDLHEVMPDANLLQYGGAFTEEGVFYVDAVKDLSDDFLLTRIGIPFGVIRRFHRHAARLTQRVEKQKMVDPIDVVALIQNAAQQGKENID